MTQPTALQIRLTPKKVNHLSRILDQADQSPNLRDEEQNLVDELRDQIALFEALRS